MALHVCVRGIGIRRSKDLRARSRKFLNLTNERKNMSTKTIKQRIALVAVAALGSGVLSVAPAYAGAADLTVGANAGAVVIEAAVANIRSFGVVSTAAAITVAAAATPSTAVMYDSGILAVHSDDDTTTAVESVVVSGGTITGFSGCTLTGLTMCGSATAADFAISVKPNAAGTLLVISSYIGGTATSTVGATLTDRINVTVTTAASVGSFAASKSFVNQHSAASVGAEITNADTVGANYVANGGTGYVNFTLKDANNLPMSSTSTVLSATATGGAVVSFDNAIFSTSVSGLYGGTNGTVYVKQGTANTPVSAAAVTLSVSGTTYATKGFKIVGDVDKITLSSPKRNVSSGAGVAAFQLAVTDSAGNLIAGITPSAAATSINGFVSSVTPAISIATDTSSQAFACSALRGTSNITYSQTNARNVSVVSNVLPVVCAGDPYKYTASLDKASYASGAIATLTIKATDLDGNAVSDYSVLGSAGAATTLSITCGTMMTAVTTPVDANTFTAGVASFRYAVGTTAGSYNCVVDLPKWNSASTPQSAQTIAYTIAGDGSTSNSDVLKAIVSLIASINKQIALLQKALLKK
jgi:hypothetical protein